MIKAIETTYRGYRFRSRLEARWAAVFDALNVQWEYEPEGFDVDGEWYLPDFWLVREHTWVEIKPAGQKPDAKHSKFLQAVEAETTTEVDSLRLKLPDFGRNYFEELPPYRCAQSFWLISGQPGDGYKLYTEPSETNADSKLVLCPLCKRLVTHFACCLDEISCHWCDFYDRNESRNSICYFHEGQVCTAFEYSGTNSLRMRKAFEYARSLRFEHGEKHRIGDRPAIEWEQWHSKESGQTFQCAVNQDEDEVWIL